MKPDCYRNLDRTPGLLAALLLAAIPAAAAIGQREIDSTGKSLLPQRTTLVASPQLQKRFGNPSLRFEANGGQVDPTVKFISRGAGYTAFLTPDSVVTRPQQFSLGDRRGQVHARESVSVTTRIEGANPAALI
jgi:hypothetical protein